MRGVRLLKEMLSVFVAHQGKLLEMLSAAINIGADIEHDGFTRQCRQTGGDGRPLDAFRQTQHKEGRHHAGTRIPGADNRLGLITFDQLGRNPDRGVALLACDGRWRLMHFHNLGRMADG